MQKKFNYIRTVLEEEFENVFWRLKQQNILQFEIINMTVFCEHVFDELNFSEANENRFLRYAIIGTVGDYLSESENVSHGVQQPGKITG